MIARDDEMLVWALSPDAARTFFGVDPDTAVRVIRSPTSAAEKYKYRPEAKLFAIRWPKVMPESGVAHG
jgi:hypothetical protein